ncbi:DinB family protein [Botrimarina sp.]|uniref:DinB family protein n=1 Tax=Botrimarina sp. TaxID=2795802 RepID=UPI0032EC6FC9
MISPDHLLFSYRWGIESFQRLTADVPDERMAEQPIEGINHPAWLIGHVSPYNDVIVALLRGVPFDNPWRTRYGKESSPTSDRGEYPSKDQLIAELTAGYERAAAAMAEAPRDAWTATFDHPEWGKQFDSVAPAVTFLATTHLALHLGQLSGWRRAAGFPRV